MGQIPVVLAASTTSLACKCANAVEDHLAEYGINHPDHLFERYASCSHSLNLSEPLSVIPEAPIEKGLEETWMILKDFKKFWDAPDSQEILRNLDNRQFRRTSRPGPFPFDDPAEFAASSELESKAENNWESLRIILKRMGQLIVQTSNWLTKPLDRLPLFEELVSFVLSHENAQVLSLNFGLHLLVESNNTYLKALRAKKSTPDGPPRPSSNACRVQSLKLAGDVRCGIE